MEGESNICRRSLSLCCVVTGRWIGTFGEVAAAVTVTRRRRPLLCFNRQFAHVHGRWRYFGISFGKSVCASAPRHDNHLDNFHECKQDNHLRSFHARGEGCATLYGVDRAVITQLRLDSFVISSASSCPIRFYPWS